MGHICCLLLTKVTSLRWRHSGRDGVSNHQPRDCLLNRLFRRRSKKTSKLHVTGLCAGNSPVTGEFSAQMGSNAENISIRWRHHGNIGHYFHHGAIYQNSKLFCLFIHALTIVSMAFSMCQSCWHCVTRAVFNFLKFVITASITIK